MTTNILFGGDVYGSLGIQTVQKLLPAMIKQYNADFVFINGENALNGAGISETEAEMLFDCGVDVITGGNHTLEKFNIRNSFGKNKKILRPENYPSALGSGVVTLEKNDISYTVINLQGRENMKPLDCPFQTVTRILNSIQGLNSIILLDFHAESTTEKEAMGFFIDGKVSMLAGTHTHIQTADERILPNGTAYITDAGMIGAVESVIGGTMQISIKRAITQIPHRFEPVVGGDAVFCGITAEIDLQTKKAISIKRIRVQI